MGRIWGEEAKYTAWLRVELAVCEAYARRGRIPADALARVRQKSRVDVRRILEIQDRVKHEMIALLTSLEEQLGTDSRFVHIGLTANDVWDTALAVQLRDAADLLIAGQERLRAALGDLARRHLRLSPRWGDPRKPKQHLVVLESRVQYAGARCGEQRARRAVHSHEAARLVADRHS